MNAPLFAPGGPALPQERRLVTEIPGPASRELLGRRQRSVARGVSHVLPVFITAAGGGVLVDADGNSLIDFGSGIAVVSAGNAAPRVVERVSEQVARFTHTCFMVTPYEEYVAVCEELAARTPGSHDKRSALFNSGAEAVENAVKIARHATGRQAVVAFDHAYHGRTNLTMALTAKNMPYKQGFGPFAGEIYRAPMAYPLRWPGGPEACRAQALEVITGLIHTQVGEENVAAVVIEPIQGEGGIYEVSDAFWQRARQLTLDHDAALIADEIQSGLGRTGRKFAYQKFEELPDIVTVAKPLAAGLPLGAFIANERFASAFHPGLHGTTFGGGPLVCATALEFLTVVEDDDLFANVRARGAELRAGLEKLAPRFEFIRELRGEGLIQGIDLSVEGAPFVTEALASGLLINCTHEHILRLLPPFILRARDVAEFLKKFEAVLARAAKSAKPWPAPAPAAKTNPEPVAVAATR